MTKKEENNSSINCTDAELEQLFQSKAKKEIICVYNILKKENNIPSKRVIEIAFSTDYEKECKGCASADNLFRAIKTLQEKGYIIGHLKKGGYIWELLI